MLRRSARCNHISPDPCNFFYSRFNNLEIMMNLVEKCIIKIYKRAIVSNGSIFLFEVFKNFIFVNKNTNLRLFIYI